MKPIDRDLVHQSIGHVIAGHYLDYSDGRIIQRYVEDLEREVRVLEARCEEELEYKRQTDRAIELLQERVAVLEKERLGEAAIAQRMHKAENESRAARDALSAVRYDRDRLLELIEWWDALASEGFTTQNKEARKDLNNERVRYLTLRKLADDT